MLTGNVHRERQTTLAALQLWLETNNRDELGDLQKIATDGGKIKPLDADEIEALLERLRRL